LLAIFMHGMKKSLDKLLDKLEFSPIDQLMCIDTGAGFFGKVSERPNPKPPSLASSSCDNTKTPKTK